MIKEFKKIRAIEIQMAKKILAEKRTASNLALQQLGEEANSEDLIHDIKTPITALNISLDLIDSLDSEFVQLALKSSRQIGNLLNQNKKELLIESFNLFDEIMYCKRIVENKYMNSFSDCNKVEILINGNKKTYIEGSKIHFRRIITNLLDNAIEAVKPKAEAIKRINICYIATTYVLTLKIVDNGSGVKKVQMRKLFNKKYTTKSQNSHCGLGLCICKELVEKKFGGEISFKSAWHKGTEVKIIIPL